VDHAVWSVPIGQDPTDVEEEYRPEWYSGKRDDTWAYHLASADRAIDEAISKNIKHRDPSAGVYPTLHDIDRMARVGGMCGCGECFTCAVRERRRERLLGILKKNFNMNHASSL